MRETINERIKNALLFDLTHPSLNLARIYSSFIKNRAIEIILRSPAFSTEKFSWDRFFNKLRIDNGPYYDRKTHIASSNNKMNEILKEISKMNKEPILVDVGPGPTASILGYLDGNFWWDRIVTIDPLATFYKKLYVRYKIEYPMRLIEGCGETIDQIFPESTVDLIFSQNAIDHSQNPIQFISSCRKVLRGGGYFYIIGFIDVGSETRWHGLHQWNISVRDGKLTLSSHDGPVSKDLMKEAGFPESEVSIYKLDDRDWFSAIARK